MKTLFRFIARTLAVLSAILFVVTAVAAVVSFNLENRLFDPDTYKAALEEGMIYERLPKIFAEEIVLSTNYNPCESNPLACEIERASDAYLACLTDALGLDALEEIGSGRRAPTVSEKALIQPCIDLFAGTGVEGSSSPEEMDQGGPPQFFKNLTLQDWEFILATLLPPDDTRFLVENTLDQIFAYLDGNADIAVLQLVQVKARLAGPAGIEVLERLITGQPACSADELARMKASIKGMLESEMVLCNPSAIELQDMLPDLQDQLLQVVEDIPDEAVLIEPSDPSQIGNMPGDDPGSGILLVRTILRLSPLVPLGFLVLIALFAVRSLKGWLQWWGIPFIIAGGISIVIGFLSTPLVQFLWTRMVQLPSHISPTLAALVLELLTYVVHSISESIALVAVLMAVIGIGAIVGAFFIRTSSDDSQTASA